MNTDIKVASKQNTIEDECENKGRYRLPSSSFSAGEKEGGFHYDGSRGKIRNRQGKNHARLPGPAEKKFGRIYVYVGGKKIVRNFPRLKLQEGGR